MSVPLTQALDRLLEIRLFWKRKLTPPPRPADEPVFTDIRNDDQEMSRAYRVAANSLDQFLFHIRREGGHTCAAKMKFRDPGLSERLGEDRYVFIWLNSIEYDDERKIFTGAFFEVPHELLQWHQPGQRLEFEADDIFDWFVNDDGYLHGGFTLRIARARLPEADRAGFDEYTGVTRWAPGELN